MDLSKIKRRLRDVGWKVFDPVLLSPYYRFERRIYDPARQFASLGLPGNEFADEVRKEVFSTDPYRFAEYVLELRETVVVEPLHGMLVARGRQLIKALLAVHQSVDVPPPHQLQYRQALARKQEVDRAVLLRHFYENGNYFHFFNDLLPILFLLERFPEYGDWPLLVTRRLFAAPYFQGFIERAGWKDRPWLIQDGQAIVCQRLVVAKSLALTPEWIGKIRALFRVPEAAADQNQRLFLKRTGGLRRRLANAGEVEAVCVAFGFEPIDTATLTLDQQIELFSRARYVVAEHGAGSTNVVFRSGQPLTLFELFPPGYDSTCYFLMCHHMKHDYRWMRGQKVDGGVDAFTIAIDPLRQALEAMLSGE
jgi:hypothetical protein